MKLPLRLDADITSECWTFYRMAILESYPELESWLINHTNHIYMDKHQEIHYGFYGQKYNPYITYEEVLETREKPLKQITGKASLLDFLDECLQKGIYPLLECDFNTLLQKESALAEPSIHEILLYGFDSQYYWFPHLERGRWTEHTVSRQVLADAFMARKYMGKEKEKQQFWRRWYLYPLTLLKPKLDYQESVNYLKFKLDLDEIMSNACVRYDIIQEEKTLTGTYYNGILAVYNSFLILGDRIRDGLFDLRDRGYNLELNTKRLYEYNLLFIKRLHLLEKRIMLPCLEKLTGELDALAKLTQQAYLLAMKYVRIEDRSALDMMADCLRSSFYIQNGIIKKLQQNLNECLLSI